MDPWKPVFGFLMRLKDPSLQCQGGGEAGRAFVLEFGVCVGEA